MKFKAKTYKNRSHFPPCAKVLHMEDYGGRYPLVEVEIPTEGGQVGGDSTAREFRLPCGQTFWKTHYIKFSPRPFISLIVENYTRCASCEHNRVKFCPHANISRTSLDQYCRDCGEKYPPEVELREGIRRGLVGLDDLSGMLF